MGIELKTKFLKNLSKNGHWIKSKVSKKISLKMGIELKAKFLKFSLYLCIKLNANLV